MMRSGSGWTYVELIIGVALLGAGTAVLVRPSLACRLRGWRSPRWFACFCLTAGAAVSSKAVMDSFDGLTVAADVVGLLLLIAALVVAHFGWPYRAKRRAARRHEGSST
jgi:hypothetical protein